MVDAQKSKRVTSNLTSFCFEGCVETTKEIVEPDDKLSFYDQVEFVKSFCCSGDRLNAVGLT